ncbi:hypothetical protein GHT06_011017 [Daphnia sinensis]|uniref:C1q domain-containing protein n=1 Tax=Daphnia sinensis TaxID=1820382 RepID=A0AAD5LT79_9CRUS|nr:hypothetical protein GHT06_011017 [Daphnia sinensis]
MTRSSSYPMYKKKNDLYLDYCALPNPFSSATVFTSHYEAFPFKCTCSADVPKTIDRIPGSCADLQSVGNTRSGLYSIMGTQQVETVYCDFTKDINDPVFQKLIGYQGVKSKPVYFYAQRGQNFASTRVPIPYDNAIVNIGNGMTPSAGKFEVPVKGTYFFSFTSHVEFAPNSVNPKTRVYIYKNGNAVAISALYEVTTIPATPSYLSPITLQCMLELLPGDTIWMQMDEMTLNGKLLGTDIATIFTGWLLQEEIAIAL